MRRRDFVKAIITSAAGWPLLARAQQPTTPVSPVLGQPAIDAFMAEELFGVTHPDQLLSFPCTLNPATQKVMKDGSEVRYQVDGSKTIVRAEGGIAPNSSHIWVIAPGARSAAAQVSVTDGGTYYQIDNGLTAVRVAKTIPITTPAVLVTDTGPQASWLRVYAPAQVLAPIQGIRHRDGTWTGTGPNYLFTGQQWHSTQIPDPNWTYTVTGPTNFPATTATVEVLENGPLRAKVKVSYTAVRPAAGDTTNYNPSSLNGYYTCTVWLEAGQPCIFVNQDTDCSPAWDINMNTGVGADRARWKGHMSDSIAQGHHQDGTLYYANGDPADLDAEVLLSECGHRTNQSYVQQLANMQMPVWDGVWWDAMPQWFTWAHNTGWYWHAYNSAGASNSNVWGIFAGEATSYLGTGHKVGMYGKPAAGTPTEHGIYSVTAMQNPMIPGYLRRKNTFGIFLGVKGTDTPADFDSYDDRYQSMGTGGAYSVYTPGIAKYHNLHSGTAQFWKQINQIMDFPEPPGGFGGMFLSRADTEAIINSLASDQGPGSLYAFLFSRDTYYRDVWDAFADVTNVKAGQVVTYLFNNIVLAINVYTNIGSIFSLWWAYWNGGTRFMSVVVRSCAMMSLNQVRPFLTAEQKRLLNATISMCGHIMWDNDFVPWINWQDNFHFGTANMPIQYGEMKREVTVFLKDHPQFVVKFATVLDETVQVFMSQINAYGAPHQNPHYSGATVVPISDVFRQFQIAGFTDVFAPGSAIYDRLTGLAEWSMQVMTPGQSRYGNQRRVVNFGDGLSSDGSDNYLSLIMGFEAHDLTLSKRMAGAWADMGQPMSSFYACSGLKIRPNFPTQDPALGDADFPGYMTVMRSSWGTVNESAVFMMHGDWANDHCKPAQRGSPAIYLLGSPMSCPFSVMYQYSNDASWIGGNMYVPVSQVPGAWNTFTDPSAYLGIFSGFYSDTYTYDPTTNKVDLTCNFAVVGWVRRLSYYRDDLACPIVRLRDSNTAGEESIFSLHVVATGAVTKPDGSTMTPTTIDGTPFSIVNGACFKFIGQYGVSCDVYYFGPSAQAFVGVWSHTYPGDPEDKQYILRIKTMGPCDTVMVPYPTGARPAGLNVVQIAGGLRVGPASRTLAN